MSRTKDHLGDIAPPEQMPRDIKIDPSMVEVRSRAPIHYKTWTWIAWLSVAAVVGLVFALVTTVLSVRSQQEQLDSQLSSTYNPAFKVRYGELGAQVINAWYAGLPPVISYSSAVEWPSAKATTTPTTQAFDPYASTNQVMPSSTNGATLTPQQSVTNIALVEGSLSPIPGATLGPNSYAETLVYTAYQNGDPIVITLVIGNPNLGDPTARPVLLSSPTLATGVNPTSVSQNGAPQGEEYPSLAVPNSATLQQLTLWANAWARNDGSGLKQVTQDQSSRTYVGLGGWTLYTGKSSTQQTTSAPVQSLWQYSKSIDGSSYAVARVSFDIVQTDKLQVAPNDTRNLQYTNQQMMDVLIGGYNSGLPYIAAWGPAGTGDSLVPYGNGKVPSTTAPQTPTSITVNTAPLTTPPSASPTAQPTSEAPAAAPTPEQAPPPAQPPGPEQPTNGGG